MTALIAILLLLFIPAVMLLIRMLRPTSRFLWLAGMLGALFAWLAVYAARFDLPYEVAPQTWQPEAFFPLSPALLIDTSSWIFALALVTHVLAVMLTSVARLGGKGFPFKVALPAVESMESSTPDPQPPPPGANWKAWAANLALTSLGLVAVLAGNLLTILLAWSALDIIELIILLGQVSTSVERGQVVRAFSARVSGIIVLLLAGIVIWAQGGRLSFGPSTALVSLLLFIAAGLRLGIFPLQVPILRELPLRIGLGTTLRLIPAAASLLLMVRTAETGIQGAAGMVMLGFAALAGLVGSTGWLRAQNEPAGRPYWILATASLALAAAILGQPTASLAWSLALLLPGSLIFLSSLRRRFMAPIQLLGIVWLTCLPFTPTWAGSSIFQPAPGSEGLAGQIITVLLGVVFFIVHAVLLTGYLVHGLRGIIIPSTDPQPKVERWVWLLYIPGLIILPVFHFILGWMIRPSAAQASLVMWLEGASALGLAGAIWFYMSRPGRQNIVILRGRRWLASGLVYRPLYQPFEWLFRLAAQLIRVISSVLEGEAGILWAFVLLVLGLLFLQQV
jgi:hypothetical protein